MNGYLTLPPLCSRNTRKMAISAAIVFPEPVGAPSKTFASE